MDRFLVANSPPLTQQQPRYRYRTPADDAPASGAVYWRDQDVSYVTGLAAHNYPARAAAARRRADEDGAAQTLARRGGGDSWGAAARRGVRAALRAAWSLVWGLPPPAPLRPGDASTFHNVPYYTPTSFLDHVLGFFHLVDNRNRQGNLTTADLARLDVPMLINLFQMAVFSGEQERASFIARELSVRRARVDFLPPPPQEGEAPPAQQNQNQQRQQQHTDFASLNTNSNYNQNVGYGGGVGGAERSFPAFFPSTPPHQRRFGAGSGGGARRDFDATGFAGLNRSAEFLSPSPVRSLNMSDIGGGSSSADRRAEDDVVSRNRSRSNGDGNEEEDGGYRNPSGAEVYHGGAVPLQRAYASAWGS